MRKKKIVIASILKPVNDTRMYEKMALSLANMGNYDVHIIGFSISDIADHPNITHHPLFNFQRLSLQRLLAPWVALKHIKRIKPYTLIINTHELLFIGAIYRLISNSQVIYDVRENYYRNILYTHTFPIVLRPFLALWVRFKEYLSKVFISHYFLAEEAYAQEFSFAKGKYTIIENKYQPHAHRSIATRTKGGLKLLFSGTLAESTGVFQAIDLAKSLSAIDPLVQLHIIGYSPLTHVIKKINNEIAGHSYITIEGGDRQVPHEQIISNIMDSNFGIICYPYNKSTVNSTPTKLYEYLANQLPILIQNHPKWKQICESNSAGIVVDFDSFSAEELLHAMLNKDYYSNSGNEQFLWSSESSKLLSVIDD